MSDSSKLNIQWFPGHMTKAKRGMEEKLKLVDMVIELRDARIPSASENPLIKEIINQKPRLIILTKIDKANESETNKWIKYLSKENTKVIGLNVLGKNINKIITDAVMDLMSEKIERQKSKGMKPRAIRSMVCGVPNVGKSTLINRMASKKAAETGDRPGVTKSLKWVKVSPMLDLLDTPGVLWPKFEDERVGMLLAVSGAIKDEILPLEEVAYYAIKYLKEEKPEELSKRYNVELIPNNYKLFLNIGKSKGFLAKGNEVDYKRVIETFMRDIRNCEFGPLTWEKCDEVL